MALGIQRNIILSVAYFLEQKLIDGGWTEVMVRGELPDDFDVVAHGEGTGDPHEVIIPAVSITETYSRPANLLGLGEPYRDHEMGLVIFIFAESPGQEKDLRYYMESLFADLQPDYSDFTDIGYPPSGVPVRAGYLNFGDVRSVPAYSYGNINAATRFGGTIYMTVTVNRALMQ